MAWLGKWEIHGPNGPSKPISNEARIGYMLNDDGPGANPLMLSPRKFLYRY